MEMNKTTALIYPMVSHVDLQKEFYIATLITISRMADLKSVRQLASMSTVILKEEAEIAETATVIDESKRAQHLRSEMEMQYFHCTLVTISMMNNLSAIRKLAFYATRIMSDDSVAFHLEIAPLKRRADPEPLDSEKEPVKKRAKLVEEGDEPPLKGFEFVETLHKQNIYKCVSCDATMYYYQIKKHTKCVAI
jgi:hypothetical protein